MVPQLLLNFCSMNTFFLPFQFGYYTVYIECFVYKKSIIDKFIGTPLLLF